MVQRILSRWGPALLLTALIYAFSSIPSEEVPNFHWADFVIKKGAHALGYGLLALAYLRALRPAYGKVRVPAGGYWLAWLLAAVYAVTDEVHQSFVPGRNPSQWDVLIDILGAGAALFLLFRREGQKDPKFSGQ